MPMENGSMHAFRFYLTAGAWATDTTGIYPSGPKSLAAWIKETDVIQCWSKKPPPGRDVFKLKYHDNKNWVVVGPMHGDASNVDEWAAVVWQAALDDYHSKMDFVCACLKK